MTQTVFLYNKSNQYGIAEDVKLFEVALREASKALSVSYTKPRFSDYLEPPVLCDIAFHFEIPIYGYFPWARKNVLIVNPEWFEEGWNSYLTHVDALIFKCEADKKRFCEGRTISCKTLVLPWTTPVKVSDFKGLPKSYDYNTGCLWLLGGSKNKRAAAEVILPLWKESWRNLKVYTTTPLTLPAETKLASNVSVEVKELPETSRRQLQALYPIHLIFSQSEALGLQAHEGEAAGAFLIGNQLPTYVEAFGASTCADLLNSELVPEKAGVKDTFSKITQGALEKVMNHMTRVDFAKCRELQQVSAEAKQYALAKQMKIVLKEILDIPGSKIRSLPPLLSDQECPNISVVTLLHNRRKFVDLAFHNLLITDYPKEKIEWIVVEDSDIVEEQASDKIMKWARQCMEEKTISVTYIPLASPVSVGEKRNLACERAQHDIIMMMDDDDHYPSSSFRRRVAWLTKHPYQVQAAFCTTIACYDLLKGTSAVNTPPFTLGLKERVSEATLTFYKKFWEEKPFPQTNMAEGEGFLEGREDKVLELQPQQIIVAMSHTSNASSRRIPPGPSGKPSCFWGFPPEFLKFLHGLAGVLVE